MAFAEYFEKNLQSAALLLQGIDAEAFKKRLEGEIVAIVVDDQALSSKEGPATVDLAVRLLARLYPTLAFTAAGKAQDKQLEPYEALARAINSKISLSRGFAGATQYLVLGSTKPKLGKGRRPFTVFVGSDNWLARISTKTPAGSGSSSNPFGAGVAACLGVANIFRSSFRTDLPKAKFDEDLTFSVLEMKPVQPGKVLNPPLKRFDLGEAYLPGVGAIGNGFVWASARLDCTGNLHLIDEETLAQSNLQRYAMTAEGDVDKPKVELAKGWLAGSKLHVQEHKLHWEPFVSQREDRRFDQVAVAVDSAKTRINVQASLPKRIFNSWTQAGEAGLSRHEFDAPGACLACLYLPEKEMPNEDQLIARALHLAETREQLLDIRARIQLSVPTDRPFLERVSTAAGVPMGELVAFEGKPLRSLYLQGVCGGAVVTLAKGGMVVQRNEVPMAFQSTFAGILLAADLVAERLLLRLRLPTKTQINLMTAVGPMPSNGQAKAKRCFCTDPDFLAHYKAKYPSAALRAVPAIRELRVRGSRSDESRAG